MPRSTLEKVAKAELRKLFVSPRRFVADVAEAEAAEHRARLHYDAVAERGAGINDDVRTDLTIFSHADALSDDGEGAHARAVADGGFGLDERARVNAHQLAELGGGMHVGLGIDPLG